MLRAMTQNDLVEVLDIEREVQRYPWTPGNFVDVLNSGYVCCVDEAECGGIGGYVILASAAGEAELLNIGVRADRQRKGLGRAMLLEMLRRLHDGQVQRVFLEVRSSNVAAISLYRSIGFSQIGVRRGYYRNAHGSEDAMTMACELTQHFSPPIEGERSGGRANG